MNIGVIGSGELGGLLASKFVKLGHAVAIANSRGPGSLKQLSRQIGAGAVTIADVVKNKEVILMSIPEKAIADLPKTLFQQLPAGVIVIETGNYYPSIRDGAIAALDQSGIDSVWVQKELGFPVVKAFNSILATSLRDLAKPDSAENRIAIPVSGDNTQSKQVVFKLINDLGFDAFDIGSIAQSWKQQPGSPIYCRDISYAELQKRIDAMGDNWPGMRSQILGQRTAWEALMVTDYAAYLKELQNS